MRSAGVERFSIRSVTADRPAPLWASSHLAGRRLRWSPPASATQRAGGQGAGQRRPGARGRWR
eukprot:1134504-Alexandrium_andersonii.AAC.1